MFGPLFPKPRKAPPRSEWTIEDSEKAIGPLEAKVAQTSLAWIERKRDYAVVRPSGDVEVFTGYTEVRPGEGGALEFWSPYQRELILHSSQWVSVHVVEPEA